MLKSGSASCMYQYNTFWRLCTWVLEALVSLRFPALEEVGKVWESSYLCVCVCVCVCGRGDARDMKWELVLSLME